jgi:hypothetical protein
MPNAYTLDSLVQFVQEETQQLEELGLIEKEEGPSELIVRSILNYSQQLSVRPSKTLGQYVQDLN